MRDLIGQRLSEGIDTQNISLLSHAIADAKLYNNGSVLPTEKVYFKNRDHVLYLRDAQEILLVMKQVGFFLMYMHSTCCLFSSLVCFCLNRTYSLFAVCFLIL